MPTLFCVGVWQRAQRGKTLTAVLRITWLGRASAVVLECVSEVAQYIDTMALLQRFARIMAFQLHAMILEVADQWPSRRRRWWCVMLPQGQPFVLCNWEKDGRFSCLADVLSQWPVLGSRA